MKMTESEIYEARKQFFNDSAEKWIDMWYRDSETGEQKKHEKDFERLLSLMPLETGNCVLDAGCGTGVLVPYIVDAIGNQGTLYELDYAENMINLNSLIHPMKNVRFLVSDVEHAPLEDASCDIAICFSCFPHFQDKAMAVRTLGRILKTRGILIIAHFDSSDGINHHHKSCHAVMHDYLPDEATIRMMMTSGGFDIETFIDEKGFYYIQARKKCP